MPNTQIGPIFAIALGSLFTSYGLGQIITAYRVAPFDEWMGRVLPAAAALLIGAMFMWSGFWLGVNSASSAATNRLGATTILPLAR